MNKRHIHVHLHTHDADEGHWVTINGARVFIGKGGKIEKGPAALVGKTHGEASGKGGGEGGLKDHERFQAGPLKKDASPSDRRKRIEQLRAAVKEDPKDARLADELRALESESESEGKDAGGGKGDEHMTTAEHRNAGREAGNKLDWKAAEHHYAEAARKYPASQRAGALGQKDLASLEERRKGAAHQAKLAEEDGVSGKEYRGRESGPAPGSKGEADMVDRGGPLSEKDRADIAAFAAAGGNKEKKLGETRGTLKQQARAEYAAANKGKGSYHKAALLHEKAGETSLALAAHAMAMRYGHDPEGQKVKAAADRAQEAGLRAQARSAPEDKARIMRELADAYQARAEKPEDNALSARISALNDELASYKDKG